MTAPIPILVIDADDARRGAIAEAISPLGGQAILRASAEETLGPTDAERSELATVAIAAVAPGAVSEPALVAVGRRLLAREGTLICHGAGLSAWPLAERCALLLLGASVLLDSAAPAFQRELSEEVSRCLRRQSSLGSDPRLLDAMRGVGIVGASAPMLQLFHQITRFAPLSDLPVLVTGETGTGKEVVVNAVRQLDPRRAKGPFVAVNCAALPKALAEAELFGHRKGAFSGAESHRLGLVRAADGGTLFLDEVGDLDLELQAKLLRVLQERRVLSIGEDREVPVDVRIMAATHRDLAARALQGQFREDLYHRLAVLPLHIPPLRERPEDVSLLVQHFAGKHAHLRPGGPPPIAAEFLEALRSAKLPGNVRQLENIVRSVLARSDHDRALGLCDLPREILAEVVHGPQPEDAADGSVPGGVAPKPPSPARPQRLADALLACERAAVEAALTIARGNQASAARLLGISARSVYTKMRKHRLDGRPRSSASRAP